MCCLQTALNHLGQEMPILVFIAAYSHSLFLLVCFTYSSVSMVLFSYSFVGTVFCSTCFLRSSEFFLLEKTCFFEAFLLGA